MRLRKGIATISGRPFQPWTSNDDKGDQGDKGGKKPTTLKALLSENEELQDQLDDIVEKRLARERRQNPGRRKEDTVGDEERQELDRLRQEAQGREQADLEKKKEYEKALGLERERFTTKETGWKTREQALLGELRKDRVRGQIIAAATRAGAVDPDDLAALLEGRVHMGEDFKTSIRDVKDATREAMNAEGDPLTIDELVADFLSKKPHLAKAAEGEGSAARGGAGSSSEGASRKAGAGTGTVAALRKEFETAKAAATESRTPANMTKMQQAKRRLTEAENKAA